jgi:hypothetical protein
MDRTVTANSVDEPAQRRVRLASESIWGRATTSGSSARSHDGRAIHRAQRDGKRADVGSSRTWTYRRADIVASGVLSAGWIKPCARLLR